MGDQRLRTVFFGTPGYAVPALNALAAHPSVDLALVVTQPDRPAGRGHALRASAVKLAAEALDLPIYQPASLRLGVDRAPLDAIDADLFVVAAYGLIFGRKTLALPRLGCVNLHASLLPRFRGASPVASAILAGDTMTGVTLMRMDAGLDTGGIIDATVVTIEPDDTTGTLTGRLAKVGAELIAGAIASIVQIGIVATEQPVEGVSVTRPLVKADGEIDWTQPAAATERQIRAMNPWPGPYTRLSNGKLLRVWRAGVGERLGIEPGEVAVVGNRVSIGCGEGTLEMLEVQPEGSGRQTAGALVNGRRVTSGDRLQAVTADDRIGPIWRPLG